MSDSTSGDQYDELMASIMAGAAQPAAASSGNGSGVSPRSAGVQQSQSGGAARGSPLPQPPSPTGHAAAAAADASASPASPAGHGGVRSPESTASSPFAAAAAAAASSASSFAGALPSGPLPAPAAGIRSFVEMGTEESDVEFVAHQLDYHWSKCKDDILARLVARQRRLEDEQRRLDQFRLSYVTHVNAMQEEIEKLKEANLKAEREAARHRGQQEQMVAGWTAQHAQVVGLRLKAAAWGAWRKQFQDEQQAKRLTAKFAQPHWRRHVLQSVWGAWHSMARATKRKSDEEYWRDQVKQTTANLIADYEKNLSELRHQLAQAEDVIRYHHEDQSMMEEKLKQAFIRGVCALNREALSVFTTPAEVAEANIRSHFSASSVGQGAFMSSGGSSSAPPAVGGSIPPPPTNPAVAPLTHASPPAPTASQQPVGNPSAPLPSSFVGSGGVALSSSVPRTSSQVPSAQTQQQQQRSISASVGRPGQQLPYPPHSHAPPARSAHVHPAPQVHPLPQTHAHQPPFQQHGGAIRPTTGTFTQPLPRAGAPRPYGAR